MYIKPHEHGNCTFRNEWLKDDEFNFKLWLGTLPLGTVGTCGLVGEIP